MLDPQTLQELRDAVRSLDLGRTGPKRYREIAGLGSMKVLSQGAVIDLDSSESLGAPLVILRQPAGADSLTVLTEREREVASLVAKGLTNKEIANTLTISVCTVKDHIHHILSKADLPNRAAIAAAARSFEPVG